MRIALLSTPFIPTPPPQYGGTELVIAELAEGLVARGHDVTLFATGDSQSSAELRWLFPTAHWPPDPLTDVDHVSWALRHVAGGDYDLVHVHSAVALPFTRWLRRLPVVYTIHHEREGPLSALYRRFPDVYYIAISKDQRAREVPLRRCTVIHHGLDPRKYQWTPRPAEYLAFVARFAPYKGPHTAIDVAERVGLPIRIAGEVHEPDRAFAERELLPRLARPHVTHLGPIGLDVKAPLLRDARALLAPLTWNEPFGLILIEAMLSGCPVVAFPRGSVPELVEEGVTGFIARDAEHMAEIVRRGGPLDDFDREQCRRRAIERFGRDRMVEEHEALYRRVLDANVARARTVTVA